MADTWIAGQLENKKRANGKLPGQRSGQLNEEIAEATARFFHNHESIGPGNMVTVIDARMDEDFEQAMITVSIVPDEKAETIFKNILTTTKELRSWLAERFPHWRYHPKVRFILDRGLAKGSHTWTLLNQIADKE